MSDRYLFPNRRDFLRVAGATAGLAAIGSLPAAEKPELVRIGSGPWTYTLDESWGKLPDGMKYGFGCAIVLDGQDRVFVTSRSTDPCVAVFDKDGKLLETWSNEFTEKVGFDTKQYADTAHGLYWSKEPDGEFLYWTENKSTNRTGPKFGRRVYKTDLKGKVLYTLGPGVPKTSTSDAFDFDSPTDVAVGPNGDIYVVDGYGSQLVHRFDKDFKLLKTIGGPGKQHGKFNTCHGVWVSTLRSAPEVYIADRANNRVEVYSMELEYKRTLPDYRLPCCFYQHAGHLYIPELGARVSIIDADDKFVARLGDGKGFEKSIRQHPDKFATPHALTVDSRGDLYVIEWLDFGRPRKFRHTPA
ncbi:MAG TPA: twin-arginine translocation signal domain-containing protein [Gemmataceae bacterium]|nr:twin-arginine translocation signal domain-containing protein [Gemmataceae bacterium]